MKIVIDGRFFLTRFCIALPIHYFTMVEFPSLLCQTTYKRKLIEKSDEDALISYRIESHLKENNPCSWREFLNSCELEEKETLNHVAKAGACQFSSLADQIFKSAIAENFRPDILLRQLALHVLSKNEESYKDFMLHANPRTRRQRSRGGENISVEEYIRRMSNEDCDGDHITLQAICDALKIRVNVVKWVHYADGEIADASSSDSGRSSPENWNIFVADTITPRNLKKLDRRLNSIQLPNRNLWISLHGEAHFKSLRCLNIKTPEISQAKEFRYTTDHENPKEIHQTPRRKGRMRTILSPCVKEKTTLTCGICLEEVNSTVNKGSLQCKHEFHLPCISQWSSVTNMCPLCKDRFQFILTEGKKINVQHRDANFGNDENGIDLEALEQIVCFVCADAEDEANLLICDGDCGRGAHTYCIGLELIPEGHWFCQSCQSQRSSSAPQNEGGVIPVSVAHVSESGSDDEGDSTDRSTTSDALDTTVSSEQAAEVPARRSSRRALINLGAQANSYAPFETRMQSSRRTMAQRSARQRMAAIATTPWARRISSAQPHTVPPPQRRGVSAPAATKPTKSALDSSSDEEDSVEKQAWADLAAAKQGVKRAKRRAVESLKSQTMKRARRVQASRDGAKPMEGDVKNATIPQPNVSAFSSPQNQPSVLKLLSSIKAVPPSQLSSHISSPSLRKIPSTSCMHLAESLVRRLHKSLSEDREAHHRGWPMMSMQAMLRELQNHVHSATTEQSEAFLNAGILSALKAWLEPLPDGSLPPLRVRTGVIRVLLVLPARKEHVRASGGLALHLVRLARHPNESEENKVLISKLVVTNWSKLAMADHHPKPVWPPFYTRDRALCSSNSLMPARAAHPKPSYSGGKVPPSVPSYACTDAKLTHPVLDRKAITRDSLQSISSLAYNSTEHQIRALPYTSRHRTHRSHQHNLPSRILRNSSNHPGR